MKKLFLCIIWGLLLANLAPASNPPHKDRAIVQSQSASTIEIRFNLAEIERREIPQGNSTCLNIEMDGEGSTQLSGLPQLPAVSRFVIIPPGKKAEAFVLDDQPRTVRATAPPIMVVSDRIDPDSRNEPVSVNGLYPPEAVTIGKPFQIRHVRMVQVTVYPVQYDFSNNCYVERSSLEVELSFVEDRDYNHRTYQLERYPNPQFQRMLNGLALNPQPLQDDRELIEARGYDEYYLFVMHDNIDEDIRQHVDGLVYRLMEWKRRAGNKVDLMLTPVGDDQEDNIHALQIKEQIQNHYNDLLDQGIEPFDNILLIGEEEPNPQFNNRGGQGLEILLVSMSGNHEQPPWEGHWDLFYAMLDGGEGDFFPDVALSRFHAGNLAMLANGVHKTISYESEPSMDNPHWFSRGAMVQEAIVEGNETIIHSTVDYLVQVMEHNDCEVVSKWRHFEHDQLDVPLLWVSSQFNNGVGLLCGRAVADDVAYHHGAAPQNRILATGMFPITILLAGHNEYAMESLFWVGREFYDNVERLNDPSGAKGAVASTSVWQDPQTIPNNLLCMGMVHGMLDLKLSFGWARNWALLNLTRTFPDNIPLLIQYSGDFQLCGDVGVRHWKGVPRIIDMEYTQQLPRGDNFVSARLTDPLTGQPVPNILVTLYSGDIENAELFEIGFSDDDGSCDFVIDPEIDAPLLITALAENVYPCKGIIEIIDPDVNIQAEIVDVDDDAGGNGDGLVNPGETVEITFNAQNLGENRTARNVVGALRSVSRFAQVEENRIVFGNIDPGAAVQGQETVAVRIHPRAQDGEEITLVMDLTSDDGSWQSGITLDPLAVNIKAVELPDNGVIDEGEALLAIQLQNAGRIPAEPFTARLSSSNWSIEVIESEAQYPAIQPGQSAGPNGNGFRIRTHNAVIPGSRVPMSLTIEVDNNLFDKANFALQVANPRQFSPQGPNDHGYYCFDDSDAEWDQAPEFFWIGISPNDQDQELPGELIEFENVSNDTAVVLLPFTFRYFGEEFDRITVCTNGFLVMGDSEFIIPTNHNWSLDDGGIGVTYGVIAPFWDNLYVLPAVGGGVYTAFDDEENSFIIEWFNARFPGEPVNLRFQVILYDQSTRTTPTGDGAILFQYEGIEQFNGGNQETPFATVGISSPDGTSGITYTVSDTYPVTSAPLEDERAILFTTAPREMHGILSGIVTDAATGQAIPEATISIPKLHTILTDENGNWRIDNAWAETPFKVNCHRQGYNDTTVTDLILVEDGEMEFNFSLLHPEFSTNRDVVELDMKPDTTVNRHFFVRNRGNGTLKLFIDTRLAGVDNPDSWSIRRQLNLERNDARGVAYIGNNFYVTGSDEEGNNFVSVYSVEGNLVNTFAVPGDLNVGMKDLAWDGELLWGAVGDTVFGYTTDGELQRRFTAWDGPIQALAWDGDREVLWVSKYAGGLHGYDRDGNESATIPTGNLVIHGLAYWSYDPDGYSIYLIHNPNHGRQVVHKINPDTGTAMMVRELTPENGGPPGGAFISSEFDDDSWVFMTVTHADDGDRIDIYQLHDRTDWFAVQPASHSIAPRSQEPFAVTFNTDDLTYGERLDGEIVIHHNATEITSIVGVRLNVVGIEDSQTPDVPAEFGIHSIYPNPFNDMTTVKFDMDRSSTASINIYDVEGRFVCNIYDDTAMVGRNSVVWNAEGLPSGVYLMRIESLGRARTTKLALLR